MCRGTPPKGVSFRAEGAFTPARGFRPAGSATSAVGRLERHLLGEVTVAFSEGHPNSPHWAAVDWLRTNQRNFVLFQARGNEYRFRFAHGEITARPGDCIFISPGDRGVMLGPLTTGAITLGLPEPWLKRWLPQLGPSPLMFRASGGWSAALCTVVATLTPDTIRELTLPGSALADNIGTLLALSAGPHSQVSPISLYGSLSQELRASLHRPNLSPAQLAARHRISLRALHYAFATEQTTFMRELIRVRLERGAELLSGAQVKLTVHEVARRCGFTDSSHFTRRFRERFGQTPAKFRSNARLQQAVSSHPSVPGRLARERFMHKVDERSHLG